MMLFLLSKTQNDVFLLLLYQPKITKNYQHFLAKGLKDQYIGMNIKHKVRIQILQISIYIFLNQTFQELTDCLFWFN